MGPLGVVSGSQIIQAKRKFCEVIEYRRDVAQSGSAPCSGRGGRKFESCHPDF